MKRETIENILNFLKEKEGKETPKKWFDSIEKLKLIYELENHPDGIQYRYEGMLPLSDSNITKLPDNLYVGNSLDLTRCKELTKLPDNLYVGYHLYLTASNITELPNNLYVGGNLFLNNSNITELPYKLHVGRYLVLNNSNLTELPNNLYIDGDLYIKGTPLSKKYSHEEIREMITSKGGTIIGKIYK